MTILQIYVSDEDMATLRSVAAERGCPTADLAEAAVSEACLAVRKEGRDREGLAQLDLPGIDRGLVPVRDAFQPKLVVVSTASLSRRCDGAPTCGGGECIACDAIQGEACRRPIGGAS